MATVKYQGKSYETKRQLAEALGINYDTLNMRMSRGLPLGNAVDFKPKSTVTHNNKEYHSYQHLIDTLKLKLTVNQLQYRLKKCGGSLDKAVHYQVPGTAIIFKGVAYPSLKKLCDKLGLVYSTVKNRVNRQAKSIEEAISMSAKGITRGRKPKSATASKVKAKATVTKAKATVTKAKATVKAKKPAVKKATVKKAVAKKPAVKKAKVAAKKPAAKKATVKKAVAKKPAAKKAVVKKATVKAKKPAVKKAVAGKAGVKRKVGRPRKVSS